MSTNARNQYGLNQQQMAEWLDVPRSQVAHYERNTRQLPRAASEKHTNLMIAMAELETAQAAKKDVYRQPLPESKIRLASVLKEMEFQKQAAAHKAFKMKQKILAIKKTYEQTRNLMELLELMMKKLSVEKETKDYLWLEIQYVDAAKRLFKCDEAVQMSMIGKIAAMEALAAIEL